MRFDVAHTTSGIGPVSSAWLNHDGGTLRCQKVKLRRAGGRREVKLPAPPDTAAVSRRACSYHLYLDMMAFLEMSLQMRRDMR